MPDLIFDTNVGQTLLTPLYRLDLDAILARITSRFRVVVSPQTYLEVLNCICGGDEAHFEKNREYLRFLIGRGKPEFLPFPIAFAVKKILGLDRPAAGLGPGDFRQWLPILLHAKSQKALFEGEVRLPTGRRRLRFGFNPETHLRQHETGIREHRDFLQAVRDGTAPLPPDDVWAAATAATLGHKLDCGQAAALAAGLDAAYRYHIELCRDVGNGPYNFEKHRGDWIDWQQLFYLCDPNIYVLTGDSGLQRRVAKSLQQDRVLDLRGFLKELGFAPRH